jgi:hypothetical protein
MFLHLILPTFAALFLSLTITSTEGMSNINCILTEFETLMKFSNFTAEIIPKISSALKLAPSFEAEDGLISSSYYENVQPMVRKKRVIFETIMLGLGAIGLYQGGKALIKRWRNKKPRPQRMKKHHDDESRFFGIIIVYE